MCNLAAIISALDKYKPGVSKRFKNQLNDKFS